MLAGAKKRKNLLPALLVTLFLSVVWLTIFFFVPPETSYIPFVFIFLAASFMFFVFSILLGNIRRGLFVGVGTAIFLLLGYLGIGNWLNLIFIIAILGILEYYLSTR